MPDPANDAFVAAARAALDGILARLPEQATTLGDHRHDDRLTVGTAADYEETLRWCGHRLAELRALDQRGLSAQNRVDLQILANGLEWVRFKIGELREHEWNPMIANPGRAIYLLVARDFAPLSERLRCVARRLAAVPAALAAARGVLGAMPVVHLETALSQFAGAAQLISSELDRFITTAHPGSATGFGLADARSAALDAIAEHRRWLQRRLEEEAARDGGGRDPRIGAELFARKLRLTVDAPADAAAITSRAEADLERVTDEITQTAARLAGRKHAEPASPVAAAADRRAGPDGIVRQVLDSLAADAPDDATILPLVERAFGQQCAFVREHAVVTIYDDPVEVIEMPEIDRGVAVAYCDPPGPLETAALPTFVAVSPTPKDWTGDQTRSFYREYNRHMVHNLMIHEGMPGHVLQLQHARRFTGDTPVRAAMRSGAFVEGWAVYAEQVMAAHAYPGDGNPDAIRMQQLKMQLRAIINTIIDARVHGDGMTQAEAIALMTGRGHQEQAEAAGKWRRALLTSAQLSTYYVGFTQVSDLVAELRSAHPGLPQQRLHDMLLAHGSPPVRHLRTLLTGAG